MLKNTYDWLMRLAAGKNAGPALAAVSFAESSFFPIPPDVMLVPMVLADRSKAWRFATLATVASVIGGLAGYAIGFYLLETLGKSVIDFYGLTAKFGQAASCFNKYGVEILLIKGMTPIPYKLLTITAGAVKMDLASFIGASVVARAMRFFLVAGLLYFFGEPIRAFIEKRLILVTTITVAMIVAGFVVIKLLAGTGNFC